MKIFFRLFYQWTSTQITSSVSLIHSVNARDKLSLLSLLPKIKHSRLEHFWHIFVWIFPRVTLKLQQSSSSKYELYDTQVYVVIKKRKKQRARKKKRENDKFSFSCRTSKTFCWIFTTSSQREAATNTRRLLFFWIFHTFMVSTLELFSNVSRTKECYWSFFSSLLRPNVDCTIGRNENG